MTIGFTGTRQIDKISTHRLVKLFNEIRNLNPEEVVHGGAVGADEHFHDIIVFLGQDIVTGAVVSKIPSREYVHIRVRFANKVRELRGVYTIIPPEPPLTRNKKIVDDCDILIALPINPEIEELRSGTWSTIRYARKLKKQIIIV